MSVAKISLHCISKLLVNKWFNRIFKLHVLYGTQKKLGKKNRNTGTGNGMRGTRGIGGMLYSGECCQIFRECRETFWGMFSNIPGNVAIRNLLEKSREYSKIIWACCKTFCGKHESFRVNVHNSTRGSRSRTLPICWGTVTVKVYF